MPHVIDLTGKRFGRLVVLGFSRKVKRLYLWKCLCDCGSEADVYGSNLKGGKSTSCGCKTIERSIARSTTHGHSSGGRVSTEYQSWANMITRCTNKNYIEYEHYGGRGIKVCDRWLNSFENFLEDMGKKPSRDYSIDRIDVNGDYTPDNCKWSTRTEQTRNKQIYKTNKSGKSGVYPNKRKSRWIASIRHAGKQVYLGSFIDLNDAIEARKQAEIKYWNKKPS